MTQLTRQELYDLVWSKPMKAAAASVSMSSGSLNRICHRHGVPMPPRGYWTSLQAGHPVQKTPLPARSKAPRIDLQSNPRKPREELLAARERAIAALRQPSPPSSSAWHPCTTRTEQAFNSARPDRDGSLRASGVGVASVRASLEAIPRALAILNEIIARLERLGHSISSTTEPAHLSIDGALVPFEISEKFRRSSGPPDETEAARRKAFTERFPRHVEMLGFVDPWIFRPSGKLTITFSQGYEAGLQSHFADGRRQLEDQLDQVVVAAIVHAGVRKERQEKIEQRQQDSAEARRRQLEAGANDEAEQQRRALLKRLADLHDEAEHLARFVRHLRHISSARRSEKMSAFLSWAESYVESLQEACGVAAVDREL